MENHGETGHTNATLFPSIQKKEKIITKDSQLKGDFAGSI